MHLKSKGKVSFAMKKRGGGGEECRSIEEGKWSSRSGRFNLVPIE
jgi:hypothetical protein